MRYGHQQPWEIMAPPSMRDPYHQMCQSCASSEAQGAHFSVLGHTRDTMTAGREAGGKTLAPQREHAVSATCDTHFLKLGIQFEQQFVGFRFVGYTLPTGPGTTPHTCHSPTICTTTPSTNITVASMQHYTSNPEHPCLTKPATARLLPTTISPGENFVGKISPLRKVAKFSPGEILA